MTRIEDALVPICHCYGLIKSDKPPYYVATKQKDRKIKDDKPYIDVTNLELTQYGRVRRPPKGFCDQYGIDLRKLI